MPDGVTLAAFWSMRIIAAVALVSGCVWNEPTDMPSDMEPGDMQPGGGEIDGVYLDVRLGFCAGGVGGEIRCSGSPCDAIEDPTSCAATAACFVGLNADATFRDCFPVDTRSTASGACAALDAAGCATREDCTAVYSGPAFYGSFVRCEDEL